MTPISHQLEQTPPPGTRLLRHAGDLVEFRLRTPSAFSGKAWLRCNLGAAEIHRRELVEALERQRPILEHDWHDLPMRRLDPETFAIRLPLLQTGRFEAKAFVLADSRHRPLWPVGDNVTIKVEGAAQVTANPLYNAFVRQFREEPATASPEADEAASVDQLDGLGYTVIPASGKFRRLIDRLDLIMGRMNFRILQLLPIHPTPTTYARMGRFGSPFAALDLMDVDPALAEFDRKTTPIEQFGELIDAVHARRGRLFLDMPMNHTGWGSSLQIHHPEWFVRDSQQRFHSPGAWGVTWEDLAELDYRQPSLWRHMAEVFLFWCARGVDGFRCDAGYLLPFAAWQYMVAKVREQYPDTTFLLEGLGGKVSVTEQLLDQANLDWAYSELFQNYDRSQIEHYLPSCLRLGAQAGLLINFAETHDNPRLAATDRQYAIMRVALNALASRNGCFAIANGVEWFATEKIDVHNAPSLAWGNPDNMVDFLARINRLLSRHPAFLPGVEPRLIQAGDGNSIALLRAGGKPERDLLILINLDWRQQQPVAWPAEEFAGADHSGHRLHDLLHDQPVDCELREGRLSRSLQPAQALCLARRPDPQLEAGLRTPQNGFPAAVARQLLHAQILELQQFYHGFADLADFDPDEYAASFLEDPAVCCRRLQPGRYPRLFAWHWPRDRRRTVVVPHNHLLLISAESYFMAELRVGQRAVVARRPALRLGDGTHALIISLDNRRDMLPKSVATEAFLQLEVHTASGSEHHRSKLVVAPCEDRDPSIRHAFSALQTIDRHGYALCVNGRGAMAQVRGAWGEIESQYDGLLAANLHSDYPVDRRIMFTRCRAWIVNRGYSRELNRDCLREFRRDPDGSAVWEFAVPTGMGRAIRLLVRLRLVDRRNLAILRFTRVAADRLPTSDWLDDQRDVKLILRPDVEDRSFHEKTKAFAGPEQSWPGAVAARHSGFDFTPAKDRRLRLRTSRGTFHQEPEWQYMTAHPLDAERGLDGCSDLFSPGWFEGGIKGGESIELTAEADGGRSAESAPPAGRGKPAAPGREPADSQPLKTTLRQAVRDFIVKRDQSLTVIAGYPWFLDWGRDTLIALRGMVAAGMAEQSRDILLQFARFEKGGTLPNMIRGGDDSNRDTSDAPLWFFIACRELIEATGDPDFLEQPCAPGRSLRQVLTSIGENYLAATANGIGVDPDSGLVFSPSHFTWMDTNFPAATPRQGYPVEIQALWIAALQWLSEIDPDQTRWGELAERARNSMHRLFFSPDHNWLADCLHAAPGTPAAQAVADNALRCNQLFAVTLGAIRDPERCREIVASSEELLTPGAIRSLADRAVEPALPIYRDGQLLNQPHRPYAGQYLGDEDTRRKPAYHNGTAWTWPFPSYCEALWMVHGDSARATARSLLTAGARILLEQGCIGHLPEIVDGDAPHRERGCGAQAWAASEYLRVLAKLGAEPEFPRNSG